MHCVISNRRLLHSLLLVLPAVVLASAQPATAQLSPVRSLLIRPDDLGEFIEADDRFGTALAVGDFNGDTHPDLVIGTPQEDLGVGIDAGSISITYGSAFGLGLGPSANFLQGLGGLEDTWESDDLFGSSLTVGDFDGDGFDDLAVGVPGESIGAATGCGAVHVLYGSEDGLDGDRDQVWHQNSVGVPDLNDTGDALGTALAAGDFDLDGKDDLAMGAPGEDDGLVADAGAVVVLYGATGGLSSTRAERLVSGLPGVGDRLGAALTTGDFVGDGADDLAVGTPGYEDSDGPTDQGRVHVVEGLMGGGLFRQSGTFMGGPPGDRSQLGSSLASGDVDGDGFDEVVIGAPEWEVGVSSGTAFSFDFDEGLLVWIRQGYAGLLEEPEPFDRLGESVAVGDFNGDGFDDAVVGCPGENLDDEAADPLLDAGVVHTMYGTADGLKSPRNRVWDLGNADIGFPAHDNDRFGHALATADFDSDGADDLVVGVPGADLLSASAAGLVVVLYGQPGGLFWDGFETSDLAQWSTTTP